MKLENFKNWLKNNGWTSEANVREANVMGEIFTKRERGPGSAGAWVEVLSSGIVTRGFMNPNNGPFQPEITAHLSDFLEELSHSGKLQFATGKGWRLAP